MIVFFSIVVILVLLIVFILLYCNKAFPEAQKIADEEMERVGNDYCFYGDNGVGCIIFSGVKTDDRAYAYIAKLLHEKGYTVVIPKQRFHFSAFGAKHGLEIMEANPDIKQWIPIGHSLGGLPASRLAAIAPAKVKGVVFLATYASADLSDLDLFAIRITAENDGIMNNARMENYNKNLPKHSASFMLEGANHSGFGAYHSRSGRDGEAGISWQEQNEQSVRLMLEFFAEQM